jgi:hypothetical protein
MISQIQNIQAFVSTKLAEVINWQRDVRVDDKTTLDVGYINIVTAHNKYQLSMRSTYVEPPAGAPFECKTLGTIEFNDPIGQTHIIGPKSDLVYEKIAIHLATREYTDAIAQARRELAEADPMSIGTATAKLMALVEKARARGLRTPPLPATIMVPIHTSPAPEPVKVEQTSPLPSVPIVVPSVPSQIEMFMAASPDEPFLGAPMVWITNPGEQIGGQQEIVGICCKIEPGRRIGMFIMPNQSEPSYRDHLPQRGSPAGNGMVHQYNCWDFNPYWFALRAQMDGLSKSMADITAIAEQLNKRLDQRDAEELKALNASEDRLMRSSIRSAERSAERAEKMRAWHARRKAQMERAKARMERASAVETGVPDFLKRSDDQKS